MSPIQILKYDRTPKNLEKIRHLCRDFEYFEYYRDYFTDDYYHVYVAIVDISMVGVLVFCRHSYNLSGDFLWVDKNYRNKHIGLDLLQFFEDYGRKRGFRAITGETLSSNMKARIFYERYGAEKYGEYDNIYGEGTELMIMYRKKFPQNLELSK